MAANPYEESYVSYEEVHQWIDEVRRVDSRRKRTLELRLFLLVWVLFSLVLTGYGVLFILNLV